MQPLGRMTEEAVLGVYAVRDPIFHGDWWPDPSERITEVVGAAEVAITHLVRSIVLWSFVGQGLVGLSL